MAVATNMLLADKDIGHTALAGNFLECVLESSTVICNSCQPMYQHIIGKARRNPPTWSNSIKKYFACFSSSNDLVARQYGQ
jgi:hypothetical protein